MHKSSGLYDKALNSVFDLREVETLARAFVMNHTKGNAPIMAGNSVHFDRGFLLSHMPSLMKMVHYRLLDVSLFKVLREIWNLPPPEGLTETKPHTALEDLANSIQSFRLWKRDLFKTEIGPAL
jgi:oligoribonuclease